MKYKLVAVDMDGTLLDNEKNISAYTLDTIKKAREAGVIFTIASGRATVGVTNYEELIEYTHPFITYNGCKIITPRDHKALYQNGLSFVAAKNILEYGRAHEVAMIIWSGDHLYGNIIDERIYDYRKLYGTSVTPEQAPSDDVLLAQGVTKIIFKDTAERIENWQRVLNPGDFPETIYCTSNPYFLEFMNHAVSKGNGLKRLSEMLGINREEVIAIGDEANDLSMIEWAGLGIAMGNSPRSIKERANFVTKSNTEDGVAFALEKYILNA